MTDIAQLSIKVDTTDIGRADKAMVGMSNTAGLLERSIKLAMGAFSAYKIGDWIRDSTTLAARYETLGVVLGVVGNNAGYTRSEMEGYAKALQDTGISMIESRNSLAIMAQAHIDLARSTELARLAQDAAVVGQINSSEAFQRMIYGIQSGQVDILRTIGLNVNFEASYAKLAHTLGTSSQALTEAQKTVARTNAVMEKAPDLAGAYAASMQTAGKQLLSMQRYSQNLQVIFGSLFGGAFEEGVLRMNTALQGTVKWLEENADTAERFRYELGDAAKEFIALVSQRGDASGGSLSWAAEMVERIKTGISVVRDIVDVARGTMLLLPSLILAAVEGLAEGITNSLAQMFGMKPPAWFTGMIAWSKGAVESNWNAIIGGGNASNTRATLLRNNAGTPGAMEETGPLGMGLHRVEEARISAGNAARAIAEEESKARAAEESAKKRKKAHQEWLDFQAETEAESRKMQRKWDHEDIEAQSEVYYQQAQDAQAAAQAARSYWQDYYDWIWQKDQDRLASIEQVGQMEIADYNRTVEDLQRVHTRLFGDMGQTLDSWSSRSADAFAQVGASFSDLISSMLKDMARMAMQKNVTDPLFSWLGTFISGGFSGPDYSGYDGVSLGGNAGGTPWYVPAYANGTDYVPRTGLALIHEGERITPAAQNRAGANTGNTSIVVNVAANGQTDVKTAGENGVGLGRAIQAAVQAEIMKQQRSGGLLAGA